MEKREEYRKDPKRFQRKRSGDVILYNQENPSNNEVKQPDSDVNYRAVSPTHYEHSPDDRKGLPPGHNLPNRHLDDVPPATSRVVPNGQYVKGASFGKTGARIQDLYLQSRRRNKWKTRSCYLFKKQWNIYGQNIWCI